MRIRVGKVTGIHPATGRVTVAFEDTGNTSLPLPMLTMNNEYSMPEVGNMVVTMHMENGSSKGFILGTYYGGGMRPKANSGYRKDFGNGAYASCKGGTYALSAGSAAIKGMQKASLSGGGASVSLDGDAKISGTNVTIGSGAVSEDGDTGDTEPDVYLKITDESAQLKAVTEILMEAETDFHIKAMNFKAEAEEVTLKCSYGEVTAEELMKRLERLEDQFGLPHEI